MIERIQDSGEKDESIFFLFGGLFFLCWLLTSHLNCDVLIACGWLAFGVWIIYCRPNFFIRYVLLFFWLGANLAGVFICENMNLWLDELELRTHHADSMGLIGFAWFLWMATVFLLDRRFPFRLGEDGGKYAWKITWHGKEINILSFVPYLMIVALVILFFHVWNHPVFLEHIDRFVFKKKYLDGIWNNLANLCHFLVPLFLVQHFRTNKRWLMILLGFYAVFLFWTGEKFGKYWDMFVCGCLLFSVFSEGAPVEQLRRKILLVIGGIILLFGITFAHRMVMYPNKAFMDYFYQRMAQQGQLWWRTYDLEKNGSFRFAELADETAVFFRTNDANEKRYRHGIYKIMRYVTPNDLFQQKVETGSVFSTSNHATYFYYFKEWGVLLLSVVSGIVMWGMIRIWLYCAANGFIAETILATRLLTLAGGLLMMSRLYELFAYKGMAYVLILMFLLLLRHRWQRRDTDYRPKMPSEISRFI